MIEMYICNASTTQPACLQQAVRSINDLAVQFISQTSGSLFFSRNLSRDYEERLFILKENRTRYGRGTHEKKLQTLLKFFLGHSHLSK